MNVALWVGKEAAGRMGNSEYITFWECTQPEMMRALPCSHTRLFRLFILSLHRKSVDNRTFSSQNSNRGKMHIKYVTLSCLGFSESVEYDEHQDALCFIREDAPQKSTLPNKSGSRGGAVPQKCLPNSNTAAA